MIEVRCAVLRTGLEFVFAIPPLIRCFDPDHPPFPVVFDAVRNREKLLSVLRGGPYFEAERVFRIRLQRELSGMKFKTVGVRIADPENLFAVGGGVGDRFERKKLLFRIRVEPEIRADAVSGGSKFKRPVRNQILRGKQTRQRTKRKKKTRFQHFHILMFSGSGASRCLLQRAERKAATNGVRRDRRRRARSPYFPDVSTPLEFPWGVALDLFHY